MLENRFIMPILVIITNLVDALLIYLNRDTEVLSLKTSLPFKIANVFLFMILIWFIDNVRAYLADKQQLKVIRVGLVGYVFSTHFSRIVSLFLADNQEQLISILGPIENIIAPIIINITMMMLYLYLDKQIIDKEESR